MCLGLSIVSGQMTDVLLEVLSFFGIQNGNISIEYSSQPSVFLELISVAIIPPLAEEFAFRGIIMQSLMPYGSNFAIFTSSLLFALLHGNIVQIPFTFVVGLGLGFAVVKTGSLWTSITIHFGVNFFSTVIDLMSKYGVDKSVVNIVYFITLFIIVAVGLISAVYLVRKKYLFKKENSPYKFRSCIAVFFSSAAILTDVILFIINTVFNSSL